MFLDVLLLVLLIFLLLCCAFWTYLLGYFLWYQVPLISTGSKTIAAALPLADIKPNDQVVDLGCGWAPFLFTAQKQQPQAHYTGYDVLWPVIWLNRWRAGSTITFTRTDFFKADLQNTDVIYCYLWDTVMQRFYEEQWPRLKPGTRLVSYDFPLKSLTPKNATVVGKATVYLYVKS